MPSAMQTLLSTQQTLTGRNIGAQTATGIQVWAACHVEHDVDAVS
jgi:hypothetical protein